MNERVPDSSGLPLRAMVMVLLFLGVIFLLLGWQAVGSSGNSDDESASPASSATSTSRRHRRALNPPRTRPRSGCTTSRRKRALPRAPGTNSTAAGFKVTEVGNLPVPDVKATTVYYTDADGEHATADAVGQKLQAPVEARIPALANQPPGVIVLVAG